MAGAAALIAAVTTMYVNLRADSGPATANSPAAITAPSVAAAPDASISPLTPEGPRKLDLQLDRVQVDDDGSMGNTDWSFQVSVDGDALFLVPMPSLSDKPGENLARPTDRALAAAPVELQAGKTVALTVNGWQKGWRPGSRSEVSGQAWMSANAERVSVKLKGDKPKGPQFVLYFTASPSSAE